MDIKKLLDTNLFENIEEEELNEILYANPNSIRHYQKGEIIGRTGDRVKGLMILTEGSVSHYFAGNCKKEVLIKTLKAPTFLMPGLIFSTEPYYLTSVKAKEKTEIVTIYRDVLMKFCRQNNNLMYNVVREMSDRYRYITNRLMEFTTMNLKDRLLKYISENGPVTNHTEVAQRLGVARPSLSRALSELQEEGKL